jgi:hypothetical protein
MSAAATAAGYLYASGRLRGRSKDLPENERHEPQPAIKRRAVRVAALPERAPEPRYEATPEPRTRPAPKIAYRTRRWRPETE